jgi:cyanophycinase-like exopeptidase
VVRLVRNAEAVFIAGGDQSKHINLWTGTALQQALNDQINTNGMTVGGTSAGLAVLGNVAYVNTLRNGIESPDALANPYHPNISFAYRFVNVGLLNNVITDSHFGLRAGRPGNRERMGRLVTFLARMMALPPKDFVGPPQPWMVGAYGGIARGLGVDTGTAVLVERDGTAQGVGQLAAYFLTAPKRPPASPLPAPLRYGDVSVVRLRPGGAATFRADAWGAFTGGVSYTLRADGAGGLVSSTGSVY